MNTIKISVIMPVYNAQEYIQDAVNSVLESTLTDFELICVDDGSKDNSLAVLNDCKEKDDRIVVLSQPNAGAGAARNYALTVAKGEYVTFLDADDMFEPYALEKMYFAAIDNNADIVISDVVGFDDANKVKLAPTWLRNRYLPAPQIFSPYEMAPFLFNISVAGPPGKLVKMQLIKDNNLEYLTLKKSEDFYFVYRSYYKAKRIAVLNESTYCKRNVVTSLENTKASDPLVFYDAIKIFENTLKADGVYNIYKQSHINSNITRFEYNLKSLEKDKESFDLVFNQFIKVCYSELGIGFYPAAFYYDEKKYFYLVKLIVNYHKDCGVCPDGFDENMMKNITAQLDLYTAGVDELIMLKEKKVEAARLGWELKSLKRLHEDVLNSFSYKIGRIITFIPRKIKHFIKK
ncbi:MAG: glycosyltransferase family 2 protein [Oscillospiraceae bacterium]|nr:glycosyltransferase family 2 protein [Oscillospiraceae bacterium]